MKTIKLLVVQVKKVKTIFSRAVVIGLIAVSSNAIYAQDFPVDDVVSSAVDASERLSDEELTGAIGNLSEKLNINKGNILLSPKVVKDILLDADKILKDAVVDQTLFGQGQVPVLNVRDVGDVKDSDSLADAPVKLARVMILNKITGRIEEKIVESGVELTYGTLSVKLYDCVYTRVDRRKNAMALLEVMEKAPKDFVNMSLVGQELEVGKKIFFGWMIKSAPAVSSLEHPLYDITLKECGV